MLFNLVDKYLMRPKRLREAIEAVVRENDELLRMLKEYEDEKPTNLTWLDEESGLWKGWSYNSEKNRYYFDDIGNESIMGLWDDKFLNQSDEDQYGMLTEL